jgi:putative membrane protein insertion efficiency factor
MMRFLRMIPVLILKTLIRAYQLLISPVTAGTCRYLPTCSQYAVEAVEIHGALHGGWLATKRICRCHPWGGSGFDPVPGAGAAAENEKTNETAGKCIAEQHQPGYIRAAQSPRNSAELSPDQSS